MKSMSTPLASIYTTSVMEHHHFNQTVTILQQVRAGETGIAPSRTDTISSKP